MGETVPSEGKVEAERSEKKSRTDATEVAFDKYFGGKDKDKEKETTTTTESKTQFKSAGSGKLAEKFGHLNLDPSKMKVGAAPPRKAKAFTSGAADEETAETETEEAVQV